MNGSSPLTRGTLFVDFDKSEVVAVHPRLRGELRSLAKISDQYHGSSPLTRGTHALSCRGIAVIRFIPAYAGNSTCITMVMGLLSVHPRLRGELVYKKQDLLIINRFIPAYAGNSRYSINRRPYTIRFIPAYAGNSLYLILLYMIKTVHPRLRGELERTI